MAVDDPACALSWGQFVTRVQGLFSIDCRTSRLFTPTPSDDEPTGEPEEVL